MAEDKLQIAIVHKSADSRNTLHAAVVHLGHAVCFHAANGVEFVKQARQHRPDLIIVQEFLPDEEGLIAVKQAACETAIPLIVVIDRHDGQLFDHPESSNVLAVLQEPVRYSDPLPVISLAMQQFQRLKVLRESLQQLKQELGEPESHDQG